MEIIEIISIGLSIIGFATVCFRIIAPLTKNTKDDSFLKVLEKILASVALNKADNKVEISVSGKPKAKSK
jgi:hypothetical protein